jgi:hypothetical protein
MKFLGFVDLAPLRNNLGFRYHASSIYVYKGTRLMLYTSGRINDAFSVGLGQL